MDLLATNNVRYESGHQKTGGVVAVSKGIIGRYIPTVWSVGITHTRLMYVRVQEATTIHKHKTGVYEDTCILCSWSV